MSELKLRTYSATLGQTIQAYAHIQVQALSDTEAIQIVRRELAKEVGPELVFKPDWSGADQFRCVQLEDQAGKTVANDLRADVDEWVKTIVLGAYCAGEYEDGPAYAKFTMTADLKRRLDDTIKLCNDHGLDKACITAFADWGTQEYEDNARLQPHALEIDRDATFRFTAQPKYGSAVYTRWISVKQVMEAIEARSEESLIFVDDDDEDELRQLYESCTEIEEADSE